MVKFIKLTRIGTDVPIYVSIAHIETIVPDGGGSIIGLTSTSLDDVGLRVAQSPEDIINALYWEEVNGQPK